MAGEGSTHQPTCQVRQTRWLVLQMAVLDSEDSFICKTLSEISRKKEQRGHGGGVGKNRTFQLEKTQPHTCEHAHETTGQQLGSETGGR